MVESLISNVPITSEVLWKYYLFGQQIQMLSASYQHQLNLDLTIFRTAYNIISTCFHSCRHSLTRYLLSMCCVSDHVLGTANWTRAKTEHVSSLLGLTFYCRASQPVLHEVWSSELSSSFFLLLSISCLRPDRCTREDGEGGEGWTESLAKT